MIFYEYIECNDVVYVNNAESIEFYGITGYFFQLHRQDKY